MQYFLDIIVPQFKEDESYLRNLLNSLEKLNPASASLTMLTSSGLLTIDFKIALILVSAKINLVFLSSRFSFFLIMIN